MALRNVQKAAGLQKSPIKPIFLSRAKSRCGGTYPQMNITLPKKSQVLPISLVPMVPSSPKLKMMSVLESNNIDIARWQMGRIRGEFSCQELQKEGMPHQNLRVHVLGCSEKCDHSSCCFHKKEELKSTKNANVSINRAHFPCGKGPKDYSNPGCLGARRPHVWRPTQVYVYVCV